MSARAPQGLPDLGSDPLREYRLGIMGGTFDPIHYGHLVTAEQAKDALDLDVVLFMPAGSPAFKEDEDVSGAEDRYAMTVLATAANPDFIASRFEIDRLGTTYTVDTLRELRSHYPENVKLYFITGADAINDIVAWHDADSIAGLATLIAATRPDTISTSPALGSRPPGSPSMSATSRFRPWPSARPTFATASDRAKAFGT